MFRTRIVVLLAPLVALAAGFWLVVVSSPAPRPVSHAVTGKKWLALTFDDGPSPANTPAILRLLTQYHAHATFFVLGSEAEKFPGLLHQIARQGSVVANHGWLHLNLRTVGAARMWGDAQKTASLLASLRVPQARIYRPPYGMTSPALIRLFAAHGYQVVLWSVDTRDWAAPGTAFIVRQVYREVKPGAIILMHDGGGSRAQTVDALATVLPALTQLGYRFVTLPQLLPSSKSRDRASIQ